MRALPCVFVVSVFVGLLGACEDPALRAECEKVAEAHKARAREVVDLNGEFADPGFSAVLAAEARAATSSANACRAVVRFAQDVKKGRIEGAARLARDEAIAGRDKARARVSCRSICEGRFPDEHTCTIKCGCVPLPGKGAEGADCFAVGSKECAAGCKASFEKQPACLATCE